MISKLTKIFICKQQVLFKETEDEQEFLRRRREYVFELFSCYCRVDGVFVLFYVIQNLVWDVDRNNWQICFIVHASFRVPKSGTIEEQELFSVRCQRFILAEKIETIYNLKFEVYITDLCHD